LIPADTVVDVPPPVYVCQLPQVEQDQIAQMVRDVLTKEGYSPEAITKAVANAMDSKVSDLAHLTMA
jgi:hypothetical protein